MIPTRREGEGDASWCKRLRDEGGLSVSEARAHVKKFNLRRNIDNAECMDDLKDVLRDVVNLMMIYRD